MKNIFFLFVAGLLFFSSCEKVVLIDLNSKDPKPVVQANITNDPGPYTVQLNYTANYYESNTFPAISGASVVLSDNTGNSETLTETTAGLYKTTSLVGTPGKTYTLTFSTTGKQYVANSTMPTVVAIDSVVFQKREGRGNIPIDTYQLTCKFKDIPGVTNYYMLEVTSNDTLAINKNANIRVLSDKLVDGTEMAMTYRSRFLLNDSVSVKLKCIDKPTYDFYSTLPNAMGDSGFLSSLPANPVNNITNGGLGFFSAYSVSRMAAVVH